MPGVTTVGRAPEARVRAADETLSASGSRFTLVTPQGSAAVDLPLAGAYNVSNALVAAACALAVGVDLDTVVAGLNAAPQVPGRLERIEAGQPFSVIVDYAHTPDSLDKALQAVKAVTPGRVITVFGCGGDRDRSKRGPMGVAACGRSDFAVVTSDNPRGEDPLAILADIAAGLKTAGLKNYKIVPDRGQAIAAAVGMAGPGDIVLVAGKGHEAFQLIQERRMPWDDRDACRAALRGLRQP